MARPQETSRREITCESHPADVLHLPSLGIILSWSQAKYKYQAQLEEERLTSERMK